MKPSSNRGETVEYIRNYLLENGYKPGDRIPTQPELAKILDLPERSLRDGINILVNQGVLIPKGRAGTFVSNPQRENVVEPIRWFYETKDISDYELIHARVILERAIIRNVCSNRTTKDLLLLQAIVEKQGSGALSAKDELELDKAFHLQLVNSTHNRALDVVGNLIMLHLDMLYDRGLYPEDMDERFVDHQNIIDAVFEKNADLAEKLLVDHLERCYDFANSLPHNPLKEKVDIVQAKDLL
ncbi:MAG: FadR family transcriptional regulator [Oscillospiraceae bacterium]|nr:FadR family transcriptional regulator [Oscillospiraceae bacterium]